MAAPRKPTPPDFLDQHALYNGVRTHLARHYGVAKETVRRWEDDARDLELVGVSVNATGGVTSRYKPVADAPQIVVERVVDWKAPKHPKVNKNKPRTWALFSDIHCPFHDEALVAAACAWLADAQPTDGIINGDLLDLPDVSSYRTKHEWAAAVNTCLRTATQVLRAFVDASPKTRWVMHPGNHEDRLPRYLMQNAPALWGIRPCGDEDAEPWHSLRSLLQLDALGIELHEDGYPDAETAITPKFVVTHGDHVRAKSGNSAHAALEKSDHSFAQGHDHRLAQIFRTKWGADGTPSIHVGVQTGCMAKVDARGLGYTKKPDWQPGFAIVHAYPDGLFHSQLAVWVNDSLLVGDRRYG